ncbi:MAG: hypothetical protein EOP69_01090, partial [Spirochaetia bacterium]
MSPEPSQVLYDQLAMQRRDVLGAALLGNPGLALDYMVFAMVDGHNCAVGGPVGITIRAARPEDPALASNRATVIFFMWFPILRFNSLVGSSDHFDAGGSREVSRPCPSSADRMMPLNSPTAFDACSRRAG